MTGGHTTAADVARAYLIARECFGLRDLWGAIEGLDAQVDAAVQTRMMLGTRRPVWRATAWLLRHAAEDLRIDRQIARFRPGLEQVAAEAEGLITDEGRAMLAETVAGLTASRVPEPLARRVASLPAIAAGFDLVHIAGLCGVPVSGAGRIYFALGQRLGLTWLRRSALAMPAAGPWQTQAVAAIVDDLYALQADLTARVLAASGANPAPDTLPDSAIAAWLDKRRQPAERIGQLLAELHALPRLDLSMLAVANRRLRGLAAG